MYRSAEQPVVHFSFVDCSIVSTVVIKQFVAVIVVSASPTATPTPDGKSGKYALLCLNKLYTVSGKKSLRCYRHNVVS